MNGYVLNKNDLRTNLINRGAYKSALDQLNRESEANAAKLYKDYGDVIEKAYISSQQNKNNITASPMFSGYKNEMRSDIDSQLDLIYQQASDAYKQNLQSIADKYLSSAEQITSEAEKDVTDLEKYWQAHLDYYSDYLSENIDSAKFKLMVNAYNGMPWLNKPDMLDTYMDSWFKEDGSMKSVDELLATFKGDEQAMKDFVKMLEDVDESGLLKNLVGEDYQGFSDWLRENRSDVYNWALTDKGLGYGSGSSLFRDIAEVDKSSQFNSLRYFKDWTEDKQRKWLKENKNYVDDILYSIPETAEKEIEDAWRDLYYANQQNQDYLNVPDNYTTNTAYKYFKDYFSKNKIKMSDLDETSIKKMKEDILKYYMDKNVDKLSQKLYGDSSEEHKKFIKENLGI